MVMRETTEFHPVKIVAPVTAPVTITITRRIQTNRGAVFVVMTQTFPFVAFVRVVYALVNTMHANYFSAIAVTKNITPFVWV